MKPLLPDTEYAEHDEQARIMAQTLESVLFRQRIIELSQQPRQQHQVISILDTISPVRRT